MKRNSALGNSAFLDDEEKDRFVDLLRRVEFFCCVKVLAYCCMSNHIHGFIFLDHPRELSGDDILARVNALYRGARLAEALGEWKARKELDDEVNAQFGGSGAGSGFGELLASYAGEKGSELIDIPDGSWTMSAYDAAGRLSSAMSPFGDCAPIVDDRNAVIGYNGVVRRTVYSYGPVDPRDAGTLLADEPRAVVVYIGSDAAGWTEVSRRYSAHFVEGGVRFEVSERAAAPGAAYGAAGNERGRKRVRAY